ncbi:energy-coupling factor transporter transmembrane component T [Limosilactobacillus reuteri]|uniref:energy-coupling factor transporter transmembrane component T n=1 Tax=Limosilactobacillus reuteri TaxID=1598 RepID=UPI00206C7DC4|nr:energy-coupling factor transporter transmembrane component T [Limosilactobacillus reuteri]UNL37392.1 energy-coupling factor transporter transmembrane protein EcfT [Limosilactobacillus reuteri]
MTTLTWFQRFDPVTKLLLILCLGLASFVIPTLTINWLLVFILFLLAISIGKLSSLVKILSFSLFFIATMIIVQGLVNPGNHTLLWRIEILNFYKEGVNYALLLGSRLLTIVLTTFFFIATTSVTENARYLESQGIAFKKVYMFISVCYILPQMMANLHQIKLAQRARGIGQQKSWLYCFKMLFPILVPLVVKTLDQAMTRAIALQLREYDNPQRQPQPLIHHYLLARFNHYLLSILIIMLGGMKVWLLIQK